MISSLIGVISLFSSTFGWAANCSSFFFSTTSNIAFTSNLGNIASPLLTFVPAAVPSNEFKLSKSVFEILTCSFIYALVSGKNGATKLDINLILSHKL